MAQTFIQLKTEVLALLIDTPTVITNLVPTFVNRAIRKLQAKHNFKTMETDQTFITTFNSGSRSIGTRPNNWKEARSNAYYIEFLGGVKEMFPVSSVAEGVARWGNSTTLDTGYPSLLFEQDSDQTFQLFPYPDGLSDWSDGEYRIVIPYWKFLNDLVADADTNWFTQNAEQYIIYRAVADGFYANEDEQRAQTWEVRAMQEYKDVVLTDKQRRTADTQSFVPHLGALRPHTQE